MVNFRIAGFSILPFDKFVINSNLSKEEAITAISNNIDFKMGLDLIFGDKSSDKRFRGEVHHTTFKIKRIIGYRNSFLPVISGNIERNTYSLGGSQIVIKMRMSWPVIIFSIVWMGIITVITSSVIASLINGKNMNEGMAIPMLMFVFGFLLINGGFSYEESTARKSLINIFEGEEIK